MKIRTDKWLAIVHGTGQKLRAPPQFALRTSMGHASHLFYNPNSL